MGELRYHYTSVGALFKIVQRKRFRLSNILFMNDRLEFKWLWQLVLDEIENRQSKNASHRNNTYLRHLRTQMERLLGWNTDGDSGIVPNVFCGCFSTKDDDLSQWRQYADDGRGVVIGVDLESIKSENVKRDKRETEAGVVSYKKCEQLAWVGKSLDDFIESAAQFDVETEPSESVRASNIIQVSLFHCMRLAFFAPICKSEAFEPESEVRLLVRSEPPLGRPISEFHIDPLPQKMDYYFQKGRIMPRLSRNGI